MWARRDDCVISSVEELVLQQDIDERKFIFLKDFTQFQKNK